MSSGGGNLFNGNPGYGDPGEDDREESENIHTEIEQTIWYHICRAVGIFGLWAGLILTFFGGLIASDAPTYATLLEKKLYIIGIVVFLSGLALRLRASIVKKE